MGCSLSRPSAYASGAGDAPTDAAGQHQSNTGYGKRHGVSTSGSAVAELLPVTSEPLFDVVGLADPSSLAVCCEDGQIAIYDWVSPTSIRKWKAHEHSVNRMAVFSDLLVSCSRDTTVKLWRVDSSELLSTFTGHTLTVSGVDFSPDGRFISSGSRDTTVRIWDVEKQAESCRNKAQRNVVTDVRWLSGYSGHVIAQGSEDLNVKLWDTRTPGVLKLLNKLDGYVYFPMCIDGTPDGNYLVTSSKGFNSVGAEARIWDLRTMTEQSQFVGHEFDAVACVFLPQTPDAGTFLFATASKDGTIRIWDVVSGNCVIHHNNELAGSYSSLAVLNPGEDGSLHLAATTINSGLFVYRVDWAGKRLIHVAKVEPTTSR